MKKNKIPSAEEFFNLNHKDKQGGIRPAHEVAIDFTKLHIEEALKEASKKAMTKKLKHKHNPLGSEFHYVKKLDKESILNAYPKKNIK